MARDVEDILQRIADSPRGPQVAAIFDYDGTIIAGYSAFAILRDQLTRGEMAPRDMVMQAAAMTKFARGQIGFSGFMTATMAVLRGQAEYKFAELCERVYDKKIAGSVYPETRRIIEAHQEMGHTVAIISSATRYQIEPAARDLDIDNILCTEVEVENDMFTGNVIRPTCFGEGKRIAGEKLAAAYDADLSQSFFYTDSDDDLPLSEAVGHSIVLNPNRKLKEIAQERGWPVYDWESRGRPSVLNMWRTAMMYGSMPYMMAASLPVWALTGNKQDAINMGTSLWSEWAAALAGLNMTVKGEEHLWSHRPAVFVFNHQSAMDTVIVMKLLKRDIVGIGKQEIKNYPVIGQLFDFAGVVFVDRKNTASAIEAMRPVVDAVQKEGKSVALSPEGTRSVSVKLGAFKKGAFHIAMQAGVPMVPVVIHNALDALPKGQNIVRPADVDVTILPPVDTSGWTPETIDEHVAEVRGMFLKELGQDEASAKPAKKRARRKKAAVKKDPVARDAAE